MGRLGLLIQLALRNLFATKLNWVIGGLILAGTFLLVVGNSLLDSVETAMSKSVTASVAGDIQIYSAKSKDALSLFGDIGGNDPDMTPLEDFGKVRDALMSIDNVKSVVPMGINMALITSGNLIDLTLGDLRDAIRQKQSGKGGPDVDAKIESVKAHIQQQLKVLQGQLENLRALATDAGMEKDAMAALERGLSPAFWAEFEKDPFNALEYLENRIAPLAAEGDLLFMRYIGTDLKAFKDSFERMEVVDGAMVPEGQRGFMFGKYFYEEFLKLKNARRLDMIREARNKRGKLIATDDELKRMVKENTTQNRELLYQLDPLRTIQATKLLQDHLKSTETDLGKLFATFFETDDANFDARHDFFYSQLAPLLQLYRVRIGDTLTITAFTRSGYMQSVNVKVHGTFRLRGLEDSPIGGSMNLVDLMSFRDLFGYVTADRKAELAELKKQSGATEVSRDRAEEELFGGGGTLVAQAAQGTIQDAEQIDGSTAALNRRELSTKVYTQEEIDNGVVLNTAVMLKNPDKAADTLKQIEEVSKQQNLSLKPVYWQEASGFFGQFIGTSKAVLLAFVLIIFIVTLVIINNAMIMAALQRVREIGTMRAIGAQRGFVVSMVLAEITMLGVVFGGLGALLGSALMIFLNVKGIAAPTPELYFFFSGPRLHPTLEPIHLLTAFIIILLVSAISTLYPAIMATRTSPLRAMQTDE